MPEPTERPQRRIFTYANVVATAALLVATTGAGVAADAAGPRFVITKLSQIKPGVVKKLAGATGPAGPRGATGPTGAQGPAGARGADATGPVPSGRSITGAYYVAGTSEAVHTFSLPMPLATKVTSANANFAADSATATTDDDATCTGTYANPTAPAGKFCVYSSLLSSATSAAVYTFNEPNLDDRGVYLAYTIPAGSTATYYGSWAYTAP